MLETTKVLEPTVQIASLALTDSVDGAQAALQQAYLTYSQGEFENTLQAVEKAVHVFEGAQHFQDLISCLLLKGKVKREQGKLNEAKELFLKAKDLSSQRQEIKSLVEALNLEASILSGEGDDGLAVKQLEYALDLSEKYNLTEQQANISSNLGILFNLLGDYAKALEHSTAAYELHRDAPQKRIGEAIALMQLGLLHRDMGNYGKAKTFHQEAKQLASLLKDAQTEIASLNNLAELSQFEGGLAEAEAIYKEALNLAGATGYKRYIIDNLNGLGQVQQAQRHYDQAVEFHEKALKEAIDLGDINAQIESGQFLGKAYTCKREFEQALIHLKACLDLAQTAEHPKALFELHEMLAEVYEEQEKLTLALKHLKESYRLEKQIFNRESEAKTRQLSIKFDLERARHEAEEYRMRTELEKEARLEAEIMVEERTRELEEAHLEIVSRLAVAAEYRDDDTGEHTKRVGRTAAAIAFVLESSLEYVQLIFRAARLHDVGKIGVSDSILLKPGNLTNEEFELIKTHTVIGGKILSNGQTQLLDLAEEIALCHHERWDGGGYPNQLRGDEIPLSARIVSVADVLDALTHERPYKQAWPVSKALKEIERCSGSQFDANVVKACLTLFGGEAILSPLDSCTDWAEMLSVLNVVEHRLKSSLPV